MCEQCSAATESYSSLEDKVLGKYFLVRATRDGDEMKNMDWGLVTCNDPDIIFATTPWPCPFFYLTDNEMDALTSEDEAEFIKWECAAEEFSKEVLGSISLTYGLTQIAEYVHLAEKLGWNPKPDESAPCGAWRLERWLFQYLGEYLVRHPEPLSEAQVAEEDAVAEAEDFKKEHG